MPCSIHRRRHRNLLQRERSVALEIGKVRRILSGRVLSLTEVVLVTGHCGEKRRGNCTHREISSREVLSTMESEENFFQSAPACNIGLYKIRTLL